MTSPTLIGKLELLSWASTFTALPCRRYEDLHDGTIVHAIVAALRPDLLPPHTTEPHPSKGPSKGYTNGPSKGDTKGPSHGPSQGPSNGPSQGPSHGPSQGLSNGPSQGLSNGPSHGGGPPPAVRWARVGAALRAMGVPAGVAAVRPAGGGAMYALMVVLYFLWRLKESAEGRCGEFSVDFAHPIEEEVATWLQSTKSLEAVTVGEGEGKVEEEVVVYEKEKGRDGPVGGKRGANAHSHVPAQDVMVRPPVPQRLPPSPTPQRHSTATLSAARREKEALLAEIEYTRIAGRNALELHKETVKIEKSKWEAQYRWMEARIRAEADREVYLAALECCDIVDSVNETPEATGPYEAKIALLDTANRRLDSALRGLQDQLGEATATITRMVDSFTGLTSRTSDEKVDIPDSLLEGLEVEQQAAIVLALRHYRHQLAALTTECERWRASSASTPAPKPWVVSVGSRKGISSRDFDHYMGASRPVDVDARADVLQDGIVVPSTTIGSIEALDVSAAAGRQLASVRPSLSESAVAALDEASTSLTTAVRTLASRLQDASGTIRRVVQSDVQHRRDVLLLQHQVTTLNASADARRSAEETVAELRAELQRSQLQSRLSQHDAERLRRDVEALTRRYHDVALQQADNAGPRAEHRAAVESSLRQCLAILAERDDRDNAHQRNEIAALQSQQRIAQLEEELQSVGGELRATKASLLDALRDAAEAKAQVQSWRNARSGWETEAVRSPLSPIKSHSDPTKHVSTMMNPHLTGTPVSGILTPAELERRKREILEKFSSKH